DRAGEAGGNDLNKLHEEAREVGNLARHRNPIRMNPWGIPAAASGEFRAPFAKKSDDIAETSSARRRHRQKPGRKNSPRAVSFSSRPSMRGVKSPSRYYSQQLHIKFSCSRPAAAHASGYCDYRASPTRTHTNQRVHESAWSSHAKFELLL